MIRGRLISLWQKHGRYRLRAQIILCLWLPDVTGLFSSFVILCWPLLLAAVKAQESYEAALFHFIPIGEALLFIYFKHLTQVFLFAFGTQSSSIYTRRIFWELKTGRDELKKKKNESRDSKLRILEDKFCMISCCEWVSECVRACVCVRACTCLLAQDSPWWEGCFVKDKELHLKPPNVFLNTLSRQNSNYLFLEKGRTRFCPLTTASVQIL